MDHLDPWAILHTQEEWALHIPQPISTNLSLPVTTTTTRDADKRVTVALPPLVPLSFPHALLHVEPLGDPPRPRRGQIWP